MPGSLCDPQTPRFHAAPSPASSVSPGRELTVPDVGDEYRKPPHPIALGHGRHDGGGVGSRPGRTGHSAAGAGRRALGGKDPRRAEEPSRPRGRAGWKAGGLGRPWTALSPSPRTAVRGFQPAIGCSFRPSGS